MIKASLRTKLLLLMSTLLVFAVGSYLLLAVHLFNDDKSTYIFEGNATLVSTIAAETASSFKNIQKTLDLMALTFADKDAASSATSLAKLFAGEDEIVDIALYPFSDYPHNPKWRSTRTEFAKPHNLKASDFEALRVLHTIQPKTLLTKQTVISNASTAGGVPLLQITRVSVLPSGSYVIVALLRQDDKIKLFSRSEVFTTYLTDSYGNLLVHPDARMMSTKRSFAEDQVFRQIGGLKFDTGVRAMKRQKEDLIVAYSKIAGFDLLVISEISKQKAFLASQRLIEKSILFALLIFGISFIVSILFTKQITSSLTKLYNATQEIMRGNFHVQVNIRSSDEVGSLSMSFNRMAGEISRLMEETADKARMEKELETAQLVQDNFFPVSELKMGRLDIAAYYKPAGECGGDWWGHFLIGERLVILIGDATGHGVPSALITAAAQSCCSTLAAMIQEFPQLELTAAKILEKLNYSIFQASRGTVKMTFFCCIIDFSQYRVSFANASHEMPLICHVDQSALNEPRQKKDVAVCSGKSGLILGHAEHSTYEEHELEILPGEVIVMYTDGLVECKNAENQMYGKGRFLRFIYKNAHLPAKVFRDRLVDDALKYYGDRERDDDITLVVLKYREAA